VCALAVCARRTTLKSGSLHFAAEGPIIIIKSCDEGAVDRRGDEQQKPITRECQMHDKEAKKTQSQSPNEMCRSDFSSSSMVTGQVAGW
jgi:hypothetical protein